MNLEIVSFQYATGMCSLTFPWRMWVALNRTGQFYIANVQSDDLWPSRMHADTHILQEKTHACGILKRHNFRVHVSLGSAEILVRRGGIINHHSIAYSLSNISAKNYRNRLMWDESIVCNISVVFLRHSVLNQLKSSHARFLSSTLCSQSICCFRIQFTVTHCIRRILIHGEMSPFSFTKHSTNALSHLFIRAFLLI